MKNTNMIFCPVTFCSHSILIHGSSIHTSNISNSSDAPKMVYIRNKSQTNAKVSPMKSIKFWKWHLKNVGTCENVEAMLPNNKW